MGLELSQYPELAQRAVQQFWQQRDESRRRHIATGRDDRGERGSVTGGKAMNGFIDLLQYVIRANGLPHADLYAHRHLVTLPGYFRPTKQWDLLVIFRHELIAAIELKSHVGPSFGNNFNNRSEEAIGNAHDLWVAYRENAFGLQPKPFVGWLMLIEDAPKSRTIVRDRSPHFPLLSEFTHASYIDRYEILCQKLVQEQLYTSTALITSPRAAIETGEYQNISSISSLHTFISTFAGHIAATAARLN